MKNTKKAFYAGSFDPFTRGHLQVVEQAAEIFDQVIIGVGENPEKRRHFGVEEMVGVIEKVLAGRGLAEVVRAVSYSGLTVRQAEREGANYLVRGLRNGVDYDYEENLALINQNISGLKTIYFRAGETAHVSASAVVELWRGGVEVGEWVPEEVAAMMRESEKRAG